MLGCMAY